MQEKNVHVKKPEGIFFDLTTNEDNESGTGDGNDGENDDDNTDSGKPYVTDRSKKRRFDQQYEQLPDVIKAAYEAVMGLANLRQVLFKVGVCVEIIYYNKTYVLHESELSTQICCLTQVCLGSYVSCLHLLGDSCLRLRSWKEGRGSTLWPISSTTPTHTTIMVGSKFHQSTPSSWTCYMQREQTIVAHSGRLHKEMLIRYGVGSRVGS